MEHALHLSAKHFVDAVAPTSASDICRKAATELEEYDDNDPEDTNTDSDVADTVGKALALVTQVR